MRICKPSYKPLPTTKPLKRVIVIMLSAATGKITGCHIKPDLVLIYQQPDDATLRLVRLGSHSELGM